MKFKKYRILTRYSFEDFKNAVLNSVEDSFKDQIEFRETTKKYLQFVDLHVTGHVSCLVHSSESRYAAPALFNDDVDNVGDDIIPIDDDVRLYTLRSYYKYFDDSFNHNNPTGTTEIDDATFAMFLKIASESVLLKAVPGTVENQTIIIKDCGAKEVNVFEISKYEAFYFGDNKDEQFKEAVYSGKQDAKAHWSSYGECEDDKNQSLVEAYVGYTLEKSTNISMVSSGTDCVSKKYKHTKYYEFNPKKFIGIMIIVLSVILLPICVIFSIKGFKNVMIFLYILHWILLIAGIIVTVKSRDY